MEADALRLARGAAGADEVKLLRDMTEPELAELMTAMGNQIMVTAAVMEVENPHFALLLFNPEVGQYIANCEHRDVILALRECATWLERRETLERVRF